MEQLTPTTPAPEAAPAPDAESARWDALAKEVSDDAASPQPAPTEPAKTEPAQPETQVEAQKPQQQITFEELDKRYKQLQGALAEERAERKRLAEIARQYQQQPAKQPEPPAPKIPDINEDPIGHFQAKVAALESQLAEAATAQGQTREQIAAEQVQRQFWGHVQRAEQEFSAKTPEYDAAVGFLEQSRVAELEFMFPDTVEQSWQIASQAGYRSPAEMRAAQLNQDRTAVAQQALRLGVNPAEMYYNLALRRGYQPKAQPKSAPVTPVQAARAGQAAAKSLSSGAGAAGKDGPMTLEDITDLYLTDPDRADKEFAKLKASGALN